MRTRMATVTLYRLRIASSLRPSMPQVARVPAAAAGAPDLPKVIPQVPVGYDLTVAKRREPADGLTAAQRKELERRIRAHRADPGATIPWPEVLRRIHAKPTRRDR
jgi:putative addiction module component (TIGR02574 family)